MAVTDPRHLVFLGTGTSVGVPMIGCHCEVCVSNDPRNQRTRCGVAVEAPEGTFLIDTPPELRLQLIREHIDLAHAAVFTHDHADHIFGLDDLRLFGQYLDKEIPLYCEEDVEQQIRRAYHYAFASPRPSAHKGATPRLRFERIGTEPFSLLGTTLIPIRLHHGQLPVLGFRFGNVAYCTDVNDIPDSSWPLLEGLDVLIIDALRERPHPTHFSVEQSLAVVERLQPRQAYFTHVSHHLDHQTVTDQLPGHVALAYDGLRIPLHPGPA
ncbi:MAG: MBL fold metallo-hydrolase [Planctomycetaceae bacterium]|nr:MBL fold metallo-hydrolase [Planctomycetaceae bacterium]